MSIQIGRTALLIPMTEAEYPAWRDNGIKAYADDKAKSGYSPENALKLAEESYEISLPEGLNTPDNYIFTILNVSEQPVGALWFAVKEHYGKKTAFIYDIEINLAERGKGLGKATMLSLEAEVKKLAINKIGLHIFAFNKTAHALYASLGYQATDITMEKSI
ncbi:GNAT family N-acetyltransferase [Kiloniella sp. EL199]|uniref:GNAT family N-acetyltransferase n=1 Tax=Kiloniella sp. EL199 TaxID=2107581 RepID=UPI000EA20B32|nr:GNAT family N-acetyltransferase [Kiloniella sp. EL199]